MPFFLSPEQKQSAFWLALWLAVALLLYTLGPILSPFIAAAILAYMLNGAVDRLSNARLGPVALHALRRHRQGPGQPQHQRDRQPSRVPPARPCPGHRRFPAAKSPGMVP